MPHEKTADKAADLARTILAAFERLKAQQPLPPYDEDAFNDPGIRSRVGTLIARAVEDRC